MPGLPTWQLDGDADADHKRRYLAATWLLLQCLVDFESTARGAMTRTLVLPGVCEQLAVDLIDRAACNRVVLDVVNDLHGRKCVAHRRSSCRCRQ